MESITTRNVNDLPASDRQVIEALLGERLKPDQQVFVMAYTPNAEPDAATKAVARKRLSQLFAKIDANASRPVPDEEWEGAIDEAMEHVRPKNT